MDGQGFFQGRFTQLFVISAKGGGVKQVTDGDWEVESACWKTGTGKASCSQLTWILTLMLVDTEAYTVYQYAVVNHSYSITRKEVSAT